MEEIKYIFDSFDVENKKVIKKNDVKKLINILSLSMNNLDNILNEINKNEYELNDIMFIIKKIILNESKKNELFIKFNIIKQELEKKIDKNTVKIILKKVYGNVSPYKKVDIKKLEKYIKKSEILN